MMVKGTGRKCSCCGHNGHNSRTCNGKVTNCIKLFGANIAVMDGDRDRDRNRNQQSSIQRSFSMGNLQFHGENKIDNNGGGGGVDNGYLSDGPIHSKRHKSIHEVKRGKPWTEEEHRMFLEGLKNLGKGDWRGISKNYVTTRTPVQVASHAQKYFLRHQPALNDRKKRRQSLFDMPFQQSESNECPWGSSFSEEPSTRNSSQIVSQFPHLSVGDRPATSMTASPSFPTHYQMFQPMSLLFQHRMNYAGRHHGYIGNALPNIAVCAPADHPSPRSVQDKMFQEGRSDSSSTDEDLLELKIAPPQSSSSQPFIRVI